MDTSSPGRRLPAALRRHLHEIALDAEEHVDSAWRRINTRLGRQEPRHIAAYRGFADSRGAELFGRVLAQRPGGGPGEDAQWWDNLLDTYRRFESDEVPHVPLRLRFRDADFEVESDDEGYYTARFDTAAAPFDALWDNAIASLADGTLATPQPVLQVGDGPGIGVISDIDDTVLHSGVTDWKVAAQLAFLHNARTRKPLEGVARLYQALQAGTDGRGRVPIFYVSSSPWNLYDLLEDFMELNAIPPGPIFLRDLGIDAGKFIKTRGHGHKLDRASRLIERFPERHWVLVGDSGQADAELYAQAAQRFGDRVAAIYIRDVDPDTDSRFDTGVDAHIERVSGTGVPMLRARDSLAMAEHAASLGLIARDAIASIAREVARDRRRPTLGEAAADSVAQAAGLETPGVDDDAAGGSIRDDG